jgi:hypothetical protein
LSLYIQFSLETNNLKEIPLTQGKVALVSDEDYEFLNQWKWHTQKQRNTFYAKKRVHKPDGKWAIISMHQILAERLGFKHRADHKNRNGLDNRRNNLRDATNKQNAENQGLSKANKSGHKGVCWVKSRSKWLSQIKHLGRTKHLGYFNKLEDAIATRKKAERTYFTHASL